MSKLPKARFNLKSPKSEKETLILIFFRYRGKKLQYSTGLIINPIDWSKKGNRAILKERRPDLVDTNNILNKLASYCLEIYIENDYGNISVVDFKKELDVRNGKREPEKKSLITENTAAQKRIHFFDFMDLEFEEMKTSGIKESTLKVVKLHVELIKRYGRHYDHQKLFNYEDVDWNFRDKYVKWMAQKNIKVGYGNKTLKILKQFLEAARRKNLHRNVAYQGKGWTVARKKAKGQLVTFTHKELARLSEVKLSGHLEKVRDICLIGSGTGQRQSDFSKYKLEQFSTSFNGIPLLSVISDKTDTPAKIPLNIFPWLIPVLEKHNYTTPKMSQQKFNDGLKELAELVGFDNKVLVVKQYMGRKARVEKYYMEKYKLVSSHLCRRSFATNLYRMGFRLSQIVPITGHSTESQLRKYIGIDNEQNTEEIGLMFLNNEQDKPNRKGKLRVVG